ncbi:dihydrodipicolinate synthase/N-acetylneuraminate lyase [Crossiella equi]|uniref:Dihydrodipicolinate synthase/N-acetylneuraminate lyase n=1 Tax=Crossiella equi TaxID=130796 RepID=A0ABS5AR86_9PSEU|nr:dihydrodipicolinate synthase family protein [Crossiella equi]MBP2479060.1 dihydrodipicolinate synthase/N-acetylneuraminate lyase [Crossiella equi]
MTVSVSARLLAGVAIPAHPLALTAGGALDERAQRALTRYYLAAGADGLAVGVHTTQFDLHTDPGRYAHVLGLASALATGQALLVAGVVGDTAQAVREASQAAEAGYHAVLLCPYGMADPGPEALLERARAVGEVLPTIGFALQEAVGGRALPRSYWRRLFDLGSVAGVKAAPFDRYRTNDIARALVEHDRWAEIALLTGNDDAIVADLVTPWRAVVGGAERVLRVSGGLLGQWAVGTRAAVALRRVAARECRAGSVSTRTLETGCDLVEVNAAVFDVAHRFAGCVAGVNEVLRQQGLLTSAACLSPAERLSPGQADLIAEVRRRFPTLLDEDFVAAHRDDWLS